MRKFNLGKQSFELNKNSCFTSCYKNTSSMIRIFKIVPIENKLLKILTFKVETYIPCFFHIIRVSVWHPRWKININKDTIQIKYSTSTFSKKNNVLFPI